MNPINLNHDDFVIEQLAPAQLSPNPSNARKHSQKQITRLKAVISEFGFTNPILIDERSEVIAGHGRLEAAIRLKLQNVPCIRLTRLTETQKSALALADNKLGDMSEFDPELLAKQLADLCAVDFAVELAGFDTAEVDFLLQQPEVEAHADLADAFPMPDRSGPSVTSLGDLWILGGHKLLCGDSCERMSYETLLGDERASMVFADPPYNVPIDGHVSGLGKANHAEFAMASGEMSTAEFTAFLAKYMEHCIAFTTDGSIHFHCMDWRHLGEILAAGANAYAALKALCVWNKTNGGMGSLYRSKHELVLVYKNGTGPHVNNVNLGRHGRYRTNVWDYAGTNAFGRSRNGDLSAHPTVKPVSLVADAIRDCSNRGALILDPYAGSGTILLAAERTGRRAATIELDPYYVDTAIRRWQAFSGKGAVLSTTGQSFAEVEADGRRTSGADEAGQ